MGIRFLLGRAGSGKTYYCLRQVRERLRDDPFGCPIYLLVPEQAVSITEQALLTEEVRGSIRARVVSFSRLGHEAAGFLGKARPRHSALSRRLALKTVCLKAAREGVRPGGRALPIFASVVREPGFLTSLENILHELAQYRVDPSGLPEILARIPDRSARTKGEALSHIVSLLREDFGLEPADWSRPLEDLILAARNRFQDAEFWVDGFSTFTEQEETALLEIASVARGLEIALCLDPSRLSDKDLAAPNRLFFPTEDTLKRLTRRFRESGIEIGNTIRLPQEGPLPRFRSFSALATLEQKWDEMGNVLQGPADNISLVFCPDRETEVRWAASTIVRLCREEGYRYRDLSIITRNLDPYANIVRREFSRLGIPFHLDQNLALSSHPLVRLLLSACRVLKEEYVVSSVLDFARCSLSPLEPERVDALQILLNGYEPPRAHLKDEEACPRAASASPTVSQDMATLLGPLRTFEKEIGFGVRDSISFREFCGSVMRFLESLKVRQQLEGWTDESAFLGPFDPPDLHGRAWESVLNLLENPSNPEWTPCLSPEDLLEEFAHALEHLSLSTTPPSVDQVLIGSIERSRQPGLRCAIVIGMNEGEFPRHISEDALLNDEDRKFLRGRDIRLGPGAEEKRRGEDYLAYIALTRASERLFISHSQTDEEGRERNAGIYLSRILGIIPNLEPEIVPGPCARPNLKGIFHPSQARGLFLRAMRARADEAMDISPWIAFYNRTLSEEGVFPQPEGAFSVLTDRNQPFLDPSIVSDALGDTLTVSPTSLESFGRCPFQFFASVLLDLREEETFDANPMDWGSVFHGVLDGIFQWITKEGRTWKNLSDDEAGVLVREEMEKIVRKHRQGLLKAFGVNARAIERSTVHLADLVRDLSQRETATCFQQVRTEVGFGNGPKDKIPALLVPLSGNRNLRIRGKIDRTDVAREGGSQGIAVYDYKTRPRTCTWELLFSGVELQLTVYMLAILNSYEAAGKPLPDPAGAFFLPILREIERVDGPNDNPIKPRKARGIFASEWATRFDQTCSSGSSHYFSFLIKKDGEFGNLKKADHLPAFGVKAFLERIRSLMADFGNEIYRGTIRIKPYLLDAGGTPCPHCSFRSLCRHDPVRNGFRKLSRMDREGALAKLLGGETA